MVWNCPMPSSLPTRSRFSKFECRNSKCSTGPSTLNYPLSYHLSPLRSALTNSPEKYRLLANLAWSGMMGHRAGPTAPLVLSFSSLRGSHKEF